MMYSLEKGAKTGELCIALLDMNSRNLDGGSISETDTFSTQLSNHQVVNVTDDLFSKGAFTRCALYQTIGEQNILLKVSTVEPSSCRCGRYMPSKLQRLVISA